MIISHPNEYFFFPQWPIPIVQNFFLQIFPKVCTILGGGWGNGQWSGRELIRSKHNTLFPN